MLLQYLELITNLQVHATPKEAGAVGETNFSSKIMCSVQSLLCTWMTLIPDEPSALGFAGESKTTTLALKKIRDFRCTGEGQLRIQIAMLPDSSYGAGNGREGKYMQTHMYSAHTPTHALAGSNSGAATHWMKMLHGALGYHLITRKSTSFFSYFLF